MIEQFEIDVEETTQENAIFKGDDFICFLDDDSTIIKLLNEQEEEIVRLKEELQL